MTSEPEISIIIPTHNEEKVIATTLASLRETGCELIVVDGGSRDSTVAIAESHGVSVMVSPPGRGRQMNLGAEKAGREILLFLHADTILPGNFRSLVPKTLAAKGVAAGAFGLGIDAAGLKYRLVEKGVAFRSSLLGLPYGDQALFMSRRMFQEVGGYPDLEIMEDVSLIKKLARKGKIEVVEDKVLTSGRRWRSRGVVGTTVLNQLLLCGFFLGLSSHFLARCYYSNKKYRF